MRQFTQAWPRGLMDKASDFESEDCEFESRRGRVEHLLKCIRVTFFMMKNKD